MALFSGLPLASLGDLIAKDGGASSYSLALLYACAFFYSLRRLLLLRQGGNGFNAPGAGLPGVVVPAGFYGGSQAGAVLRYRLDANSALRPTIYLRASSGLQYPRGEEVAAGFSIRPVAGRNPASASSA